jgi:hypothetical protein
VTAHKQGLRTAVVASLITTPATGLTRMARVNFAHNHPSFLCLVEQEAMELGKTPTMQPPLTLSMSQLGSLTNVGQVLNHNGTTWGSMLHNAFGKHMIMVSSLPKQFARKLFQVPFGRARSFSLQFSTEAEDAAFLLFPTPFTQDEPRA